MAKKDRAILLGLKGISHSIAFGGDKEIAKLKEEEKITFQKEENISTSKREDKIGIMMKEALEVKILVREFLPNVPQISAISLEENEVIEI